MAKIGIIGGTGVTRMKHLTVTGREVLHTPYGEPSGIITRGTLFGHEVVFLARHGYTHNIPPHKINYRANVWGMKHLEVDCVVAFAAVGGITEEMAPGKVVIPDQLVDYTYGRPHTFFEEDLSSVTHIDFSEPYCPIIRPKLIEAARAAEIAAIEHGVYAVTQGPRLETAAEINRLESDGCTLVGMTAMPEAALAKELELGYATLAIVANYAAGRGDGPITMDDIQRSVDSGMKDAIRILEAFLPRL
ncbi:MAG: S-methyl-5'-thioinosine phosphorylase [bacterium]